MVHDGVSRARKSHGQVALGKKHVRAACLKDMLEFKFFPSSGVRCCFYSQFCQEQFLHMDKQEQAKHLPWKECGQFQNCEELFQTLLHIYLGTLQRWMAT